MVITIITIQQRKIEYVVSLKNDVKTNDSVIIDKPYRKSKRKISMPSASPNNFAAEIKNTKHCY